MAKFICTESCFDENNQLWQVDDIFEGTTPPAAACFDALDPKGRSVAKLKKAQTLAGLTDQPINDPQTLADLSGTPADGF